MGIRNKLVLCLLSVLFPLAAVGAFATHLVDLQMVERTTAALANTQRLEAARIEQILHGYANNARGLASGPHLRDFVSAVNDYQHNRDADDTANAWVNNTLESSAAIGGYDGFAVIDPEAPWPLQQLALAMQRKAGIIGTQIVELKIVNRENETLGESIGFSWTPADVKLIDRSMRTVKSYFGDAFVNPEGRERLGIVSPIISTEGAVVGALIMESRLGPIIDMISKHEHVGDSIEAHIAQPTPGGGAQFITPLRFDRKAAFSKTVPADSDMAVNLALKSPESQVIKSLDYRGIESFLAIQTIAETGWGLVVKVDTSEIKEPAIQLRQWLLWATAASIGFVALIYLFFLVPIVRRLNKAALAARQIMGGNLSAEIIDTSNDEITELAASINTLAHDLQADQKMRREVEQQLRHQALHDDLTGLLNRKHANRVIEQLTHESSQVHSVIFLDLNGFKDVNDLFGHAAGDAVLSKVARRLAQQMPPQATLARWGGDEFVVILPGYGDKQATRLASSLHKVFDKGFDSNVGHHNIGCSIGMATSSRDKSIDAALIEADALMYEQKKSQRIHQSKSGLTTRGVERALMEDRMEMWFQPTVELERPGNYTLVGATAELRMRNNQGAYVLTDEFVPDIQDTTVIRALDTRTLDLALRTLRRWNMAGIVDQGFQLSIALSDSTFKDRTFAERLQKKLKVLDISATQLQIELPGESRRMDNEVVDQLHRLDVPLALNGVCSEPEQLQCQMSASRASVAIVGKTMIDETGAEQTFAASHLIDACKKRDVIVQARCVESREQLSQLHALGVSQFQGRLFEQPSRAVDFVSRWGQTRMTGLGKTMTSSAGLRLAG